MLKEYDKDDYREFWRTAGRSVLHDAEASIVRALLPNLTDGWTADVGGGFGRMLPAYWTPDQQVVLVDAAKNLLTLAAQSHNHSNVYGVCCDAYGMPFRDGSFDTAIVIRMFHHMDEPRRFLNELARVTRTGARVLVSYSNKRNMFRLLKRGRSSLRQDHEEYGALLFGTHPRHFERLARNAGFALERTLGTGIVDQLAPVNGVIDRKLAVRPWGFRAMRAIERVADRSVGRIGLAPLHFALLRKTTGSRDREIDRSASLIQILLCPRCRGELGDRGTTLECEACRVCYRHENGVINFRSGSER